MILNFLTKFTCTIFGGTVLLYTFSSSLLHTPPWLQVTFAAFSIYSNSMAAEWQ